MSYVWRNQKEGEVGEGRRAGGRGGSAKWDREVEDEEKKEDVRALKARVTQLWAFKWVQRIKWGPTQSYWRTLC